MRILGIRFKNLNSLVGEWSIDLTHPAYLSEGIFAITGPTGAGKTTILDAVCLALYGRTPRLNKVTQSGNEIMSRRSGECYAEVTFETQAGRYRCHWAQHRSRKRADGELQSPKHEIVDDRSGKVLENKRSDVLRKVEEVTGMDFDRFTRSMLLAQGGFDKFLKANAAERAPILEQITGTEIYSQISMRVHERRGEERNRLEVLQAELEGLSLLSKAEELELREKQKKMAADDERLSKKYEQIREAIAWIDTVKGLEDVLNKLAEQKKSLLSQIEAFAPEQEKLDRANRVLELSGEYADLRAKREEQEADQKALKRHCAAKPERSRVLEEAKSRWQEAQEALQAAKAEREAVTPVIRKVRALDLKIGEKCERLVALKKRRLAAEGSLNDLKAEQEGDRGKLSQKQARLEEVYALEKEKASDAVLVERLAGIRERLNALRRLDGDVVKKQRERDAAKKEAKEAEISKENEAKNLAVAQEEERKHQEVLDEKRAECEKILKNRAIGDWRKEFADLGKRQKALERAVQIADDFGEAQKQIERLRQANNELASQRHEAKKRIEEKERELKERKKELDYLRTQFMLEKKIASLEEERKRLQKGVPCPLCGAREHPYADENSVPDVEETQRRLETFEAETGKIGEAVAKAEAEMVSIEKEIERNEGWLKEEEERAKELLADLARDRAAFAPDVDERLWREKAKELLRENAEALERAERIVRQAEAIEEEISKLQKAHEKAKEALSEAKRKSEAANLKHENACDRLGRLEEEVKGLEEELKEAKAVLESELKPFGIEAVLTQEIDTILEQLRDRRDRWSELLKEKAALERGVEGLKERIAQRREEIERAEEAFANEHRDFRGQLRECARLRRERRKLFGAKTPDVEEKRFEDALKRAEAKLEAERKKIEEAKQEFDNLTSKIKTLEEKIANRREALEKRQKDFLNRLQACGFKDEEDYLAASLEEDARRELAEKANKLRDEQTAILAREEETKRELEAQNKKRLSEEPKESLEKELKELEASQKALRQEIGAVEQTLQTHDRNRREFMERQKKIEAQQRECERWDRLHELIGSADGKKYRNFAQGLTFEIVIAHANWQLRQMSDRYLLVRDKREPLALNVIDNYQAGEVRSTTNLSGGESFIVSLSLALGLSSLASGKVRVDSLFLDEGFGTLDEEALETALEALGNLRQEGKLIGMISHVAALKERIATQIRVIAKTGGQSVIEGPGVGET